MNNSDNKQKNESVKVKFILDETSNDAAKRLNSEEFKQEVKETARKIVSEKSE